MTTPPDMHLWSHVTRSVTPLGQPLPSTSVPRRFADPLPAQIDLHGLTIEEAHAVVRDYIDVARTVHARVTVITGRSGEICREFPSWAVINGDVRQCEERNGGGAFQLSFRKR